MNIFTNFQNIYIPLYNTQQNVRTIILTQDEYNNLLKNEHINILKKKYLYIQNCEYLDILHHYSLILKNKNDSYALVNYKDDKLLYKITLNKKYEHIYKNNNFFYEPFEAYIPLENELCIVYQRNQFTKDEIIRLLEYNNNYIYSNGTNNLLIEDYSKNNIKDINLLLQIYIPQLPKRLFYNKYNLNEYMKYLYKKVYNEISVNNGSLIKFFTEIQKISEFTIFGGIALKYYYKKYNIIEKYNFLESNDYDLNISYIKKDENEKYDEIVYINYIVFMIYNINLYYLKKIIDKNIQLNVNNEKSPYINLYMTFSEKESMNIYIWFLSHHNIFKLKSYYSNNLCEKPYIYKAIFVSNELNSILTLKYIENSIVDVKSIIKLEVHNNQIDTLEQRVNKNYALIDFIFRNNINLKFSNYDKNDKVYYNNPIFLMLVYIDLIQKYKANCATISYRKKLGKEEKDKMRYTFIVKELLIPYINEQNDYVLNKLFECVNNNVGKELLINELLKFKCEKNIYNQMDEFYEFLINKVEEIIYKHFNNEIYRNIKINDYQYNIIKYDIIKYVKRDKIKEEIKEEIKDEINDELLYKINDFLRILYDEKYIEYNIINIYNDRLNKKLLSLEYILKKDDYELNDKINKLMKLYNNFENIKNDYIGIEEKIMKIKYKNAILYNQEKSVIEKINFINEKLQLIELNVEISNKDLIFKEKLTSILKKKHKAYKEEDKKIRIAKKAEQRRLEIICKEKEEELRRIYEEKMHLEKLEKEKQIKKELEIIRQKEYAIKKRTRETEAMIKKYKDNILYIPRKIYVYGTNVMVNVKNKGHNLAYNINYIYRNISFFTILKICGLLAMIGIIFYGKYLHYLEEQKNIELMKAEESKIKYNKTYNYKYNNSNIKKSCKRCNKN